MLVLESFRLEVSMKKWFVIGAILFTSVAIASEVTFAFKSNRRVVDTITKNGKQLAEVGELAWALGVQYTQQGSSIELVLGRKAKITVTGSGGGQFDWVYVDPFVVAKGLGYSAKFEKITDPKTKVQSEVIRLEYTQKISCKDFIYWQDAQKFYLASAKKITEDREERDPFNLGAGRDGSPCDELPRLPN